MNSENFHEYVKNPSMLHQVSYQELKSLVLQYPYSPNLRYLLMLKSLLDQSKDFDKNQVLASLSSPDRKKLRQLVKQYTRLREMQENYSLNEDFLELKDLSVLEKLIEEPPVEEAPAVRENLKAEAVAPPTSAPIGGLDESDEEIEEDSSDLSFLFGLNTDAEEPAFTEESTEASPDSEVIEEQPSQADASLDTFLDDYEDESIEAEAEQLEAATDAPPVDDLVEEAPSIAQTAADIPLEITNEPDLQPSPKPRSSFNTWLKQLTPPQAGVLKGGLKDISLNNRHAQPAEPIIEADAKQIADHSVEEDEEIASETLALLLEKQKLYAKAISMYERLSLLNPEKSSLFAAKIEELNKKL